MKKPQQSQTSVLPEAGAADDLRAADWKDGKFRFPLSRPVRAFDEERRELVFREPLGADILECGNPVRFDPAATPPTVDFDDRKMGAMLARLGDVPLSTIGQMAPRDFVQACWVVAPFFMPV